MLKIFNCYIPWQVFTLSELVGGLSNLPYLFTVPLVCRVLLRIGGSVGGTFLITLFYAFVFFLQRRIASGLPLRYASLKAFRRSKDNFRNTSQFKASLWDKKATAADAPTGTVLGSRPVAVVTGGECGMGKVLITQLAIQGFDVFLCCPFEDQAKRVVEKLSARKMRGAVHYVHLDLADDASVRQCAAEIQRRTGRLDILINNAGMVAKKGTYRRNKRGQEIVLAVNFLGHVLLTELLMDLILRSGPSRIVFVSSLLELNADVPTDCKTPLGTLLANCDPTSSCRTRNYSLSKLLTVCYVRDLARRLAGTETATVALHPGVVLTAIFPFGALFLQVVMRTSFKFAAEGAEVALYCALADDIRSGSFYADCKEYDCLVSPLALDEDHNRQLTSAIQKMYNLEDLVERYQNVKH